MNLQRYARQLPLHQLGPEGQLRLAKSSVLVLGCGALGSNQAALLARAGVGRLRLVDRDLVQLNNLHRQTLYDESDAAACIPKAEAAKRRLEQVNHEIAIEAAVVDATASNLLSLLAGVNIVLDGTDNAETRYLLNDLCVQLRLPWIYGGAVESSGIMLPIEPGLGPCLRCVFENPPAPGVLPTCDVVGVLNTAPAVVAALQVTEALRILVGSPRDTAHHLVALDVWTGRFQRLKVTRNPQCPCCGLFRFEFLSRDRASTAVSLCGRSAVQITPTEPLALSLDALAQRLMPLGEVRNNGHLLRFRVEDQELVIFKDGRTIVHGTGDASLARRLYTRFIGG